MKISQENKFKILMVAAEASSSLYAQRLLEEWKRSDISVEAFGVGSQAMERLGFECIGRSEELAVMGFAEVLGSFRKIYDVFFKLIDAAEKKRPDVIVLLDYPDFNFRLAKKLKKKGFKIVYYISPQVWAWRTSRVKLIRKYIDKVLVLFPFEVDFYKRHNIDVSFVGHPLLDEIRPELLSTKYQNEQKSKYGVLENQKILGLMPGSRLSELKLHLETQVSTAQKVLQNMENIKVMLFIAPTLNTEDVRNMISNFSFPIIFVKKDPFEMVAMADVILCASGTATLTVGLMEKPMLIMYKFKKLTMLIAKIFMKRPRFFGMANLILEESVCPEFLQDEATPESLSKDLLSLLKNEESYNKQKKHLNRLQNLLGDKGATKRVAKILLEYKTL